MYSLLHCRDSRQALWTVSLVVTASDGRRLLFDSWAPDSQYANVKRDLDTMLQTLRLAGGASLAEQRSAPQVSSSTNQPAPNPFRPTASPPSSSVPVAMKTAGFDDPEFQVNYFTTRVPSDWFFQGGMTRGNPCEGISSPFFRLNSPDGLSGYKLFPRVDLGWSNNPIYIPKPDSGCLPYDGEISAACYMQYLVALLHVNFVKDITDPAELDAVRSEMQQGVYGRTTYIADAAKGLATFNINGIPEDEQIGVRVQCHVQVMIYPRGTSNNFCTIFANLFWAPQGKLQSAVSMLRPALEIRYNPEWVRRWKQNLDEKTAITMARNNQYWADLRAATTNYYNSLNQQIIANGQASRAQLDRQYQIHEQQIATMNRGGDMATARALSTVNAQSRMAADVCDYALGVQRRVNPITGEAYKTNSNFTYDWVNSEGHHILTNYVNDNPNGLNGRMDWTLTNNEHN